MTTLKNLLISEPVLIVGLIEAGLVAALAFGLDMSPEQMAAILAFANIALAALARALVTPVASLPAEAEEFNITE